MVKPIIVQANRPTMNEQLKLSNPKSGYENASAMTLRWGNCFLQIEYWYRTYRLTKGPVLCVLAKHMASKMTLACTERLETLISRLRDFTSFYEKTPYVILNSFPTSAAYIRRWNGAALTVRSWKCIWKCRPRNDDSHFLRVGGGGWGEWVKQDPGTH